MHTFFWLEPRAGRASEWSVNGILTTDWVTHVLFSTPIFPVWHCCSASPIWQMKCDVKFYLGNNSETIQVLGGAARTPLSAPPCEERKVFVIFVVKWCYFFLFTSGSQNEYGFIIHLFRLSVTESGSSDAGDDERSFVWTIIPTMKARTFRFTDAIVFALGNSLELWL